MLGGVRGEKGKIKGWLRVVKGGLRDDRGVEKMIGKKVSKINKKVGLGAAVAVTVATAGFLWLASGKGKPVQVPAYTVSRVIDGDTFVTAENQYIRLSSAEAPELDYCGGKEAKAALEKLILGKPVYLKVVYRDPYQRLVSLVYAGSKFVNEEMLSGGHSYYLRSSPGEIGEKLSQATEKARQKKVGIFSNKCTQKNNLDKPTCNVKGNTRNGNIYYLPGCGVYDNVEVQLYLGDQWFCNEKEAQRAGWRKALTCN